MKSPTFLMNLEKGTEARTQADTYERGEVKWAERERVYENEKGKKNVSSARTQTAGHVTEAA